MNNPNKTSVNVISSKDVFVQDMDGDHIVVINVPRAEHSQRPTYVMGITYRRNGEGDYGKPHWSVSWKGTVEQYAGRLHRDYPGKKDVFIYDYVDSHIPVFDSMPSDCVPINALGTLFTQQMSRKSRQPTQFLIPTATVLSLSRICVRLRRAS